MSHCSLTEDLICYLLSNFLLQYVHLRLDLFVLDCAGSLSVTASHCKSSDPLLEHFDLTYG